MPGSKAPDLKHLLAQEFRDCQLVPGTVNMMSLSLKAGIH
ncbi:mCG148029 [Mus musculus]|nr:mCG148029 [Mus musculus]